MPRPFKGPTKGKLFHSIELGADEAVYTHVAQTKKPGKRRLAIDAKRVPDPRESIRIMNRIKARLPEKLRDKIKLGGRRVQFTHELIDDMIRKGQKTRHFTVLFPQANWADFDYLFNNIHKILLPNGRIRIYFDSTSLMKMVKTEAEKKGLKTSVGETNRCELKNVPSSFTENPFETRFPKLEITFGLKKAIPNKDARRKWPEK